MQDLKLSDINIIDCENFILSTIKHLYKKIENAKVEYLKLYLKQEYNIEIKTEKDILQSGIQQNFCIENCSFQKETLVDMAKNKVIYTEYHPICPIDTELEISTTTLQLPKIEPGNWYKKYL